MTDQRILRIAEVLAMISLSKPQVYKMMNAGDFPRPIRLTGKAVGWRLSDVQAWIDTRLAA